METKGRTGAPIKLALIEPRPDDAAGIEVMLESSSLPLEVRRAPWPVPFERPGVGDADLVLLGLERMDASGREALGLLHAAYPRVPVVVLAGPDACAWAGEAVRRGAMHVLQKSLLTAESLSSTVRHCLCYCG